MPHDQRHDVDQEDGPDAAGQTGGTAALPAVPPALAASAARISRQAVDQPAACPHIPAPFINARAPEAGAWCGECGYDHTATLLTDRACSLCPRPAGRGPVMLPADGYEVIARLCTRCRAYGPVPAPATDSPTRKESR
ncbi:hypothetical protein AB0N09_21755 [Streptomyces erythrochromogenes]|uniref:hypothetical protein n=1 Tax=Streptomyces erythrochromogenes TaxID=285574 RepID=UPI00342A2446